MNNNFMELVDDTKISKDRNSSSAPSLPGSSTTDATNPRNRNMSIAKKQKRLSLIEVPKSSYDSNEVIAIHKDDFEVFKIIASCHSYGIGAVDENKRILSLEVENGFEGLHRLPSDIWRLSALKILSINSFFFDSKILDFCNLHVDDSTSFLGDLKKLENLTLGGMMLKVPEEIRNLSNLKVLRLFNRFTEGGLWTIPTFIGNLEKLEILTISWAVIEEVPEEIGNLTNLKVLNLSHITMSSLPTCIGNLKKLEVIHIEIGLSNRGRPQDFWLPSQCWQLYALRKIVIIGWEETSISIPSSIEQLQNLQELYLKGNVTLPKEIGSLKRLMSLYLESSAASHSIPLESLPQLNFLEISWGLLLSWVRQTNFRVLPNLKFLHIIHRFDDSSSTVYSDGVQEIKDFVLDLVKASPSLGEVYTSFEQEGLSEIACALACNRVSHRMRPFCRQYEETSLLLRKLWPKMLSNATNALNNFPLVDFESHAFISLDEPSFSHLHDDEYRRNRRPKKPAFEMHDAIYQLLIHGRESLVQVLLDR